MHASATQRCSPIGPMLLQFMYGKIRAYAPRRLRKAIVKFVERVGYQDTTEISCFDNVQVSQWGRGISDLKNFYSERRSSTYKRLVKMFNHTNGKRKICCGNVRLFLLDRTFFSTLNTSSSMKGRNSSVLHVNSSQARIISEVAPLQREVDSDFQSIYQLRSPIPNSY